MKILMFVTAILAVPSFAQEDARRIPREGLVIERRLKTCLEIPSFDEKLLVRKAHGPGAFDEFEYDLIYNKRTEWLVLYFPGYGGKQEQVRYETIESQRKHFRINERDGNAFDLERAVKQHIGLLSAERCP